MRPFDGSLAANVELAGVRRPERGWRSPAAQSLCDETGIDDPVRAVVQRAADLVAESGLKRPFSKLGLLASLQDVHRIESVSMGDAGRLVPVEDGLVIQVNSAHPVTKQNFSICHEISHTLIPSYWDGPPLRVDSQTGLYAADLEEEFLCDLGASELLMPTVEFVQRLAWHKVHVYSIELLAKEFGASREAVAIKCVQCGAVPLAAIVWEPVVAERKTKSYESPVVPLRVKFACCGRGFEHLSFPKGSVIDGGSRVQKVYRQDGWDRGEEELPTARGPVRFHTESQAFRYPVNGGWERKVITFVFA